MSQSDLTLPDRSEREARLSKCIRNLVGALQQSLMALDVGADATARANTIARIQDAVREAERVMR